MKYTVFTVFDSKAKLHLTPFFLRSVAEAVRAFGDLCNESDHQFGKHPEDYLLVNIGEYDETSGSLTPLKEPVALVRGDQMVITATDKAPHLKGNGVEQYQEDLEVAVEREKASG